jgi:hypothetical protein
MHSLSSSTSKLSSSSSQIALCTGTGVPVIFGLCGRNGLNESFVDAANVSQTRRCGSRKSTLAVECSNELVTATRELISLPDPNSLVTLTSCHSGRLISVQTQSPNIDSITMGGFLKRVYANGKHRTLLVLCLVAG